MIVVERLLLLLFAHFVTDFGLQTNWLAENKHRDNKALVAHAMVNGAGVVAITGSVWFGMLEAILHGYIDRKPREDDLDQTLHLLTKILIVTVWSFLT